MIDFKALTAPFHPDDIHWRVGATNKDKTKGLALAYMDARAVMDRLDAVCEPAGWQCRYPHANGKTVCEIGLHIDGEWIWKADGAGDTDHEAEKGALSDSFKRAAFRWGIGRYLYSIKSPWVEIESFGRSYKIKDSELPRLRKLVGGGGNGTSKEAVGPPAAGSPPPARAKVWTDTAIKALQAMQSDRDLDKWLDQNTPALEKLQDKHPDLYETVQGAFEKAKRELSELRTGAAA